MKFLLLIVIAFSAISSSKSSDWELMSTASLGVSSKLCVTEKGAIFLYDKDSLWKSESQGREWVKLSSVGFSSSVYHMTEVSGNIYAASPAGSAGLGVFKSADNGNSFQQIGAITVADGGTITQLVYGGGRMVAQSNKKSLYTSTDLGVTWLEVALPAEVSSIVDVAIEGTLWYVVGTGGVFTSENNGSSWTKLAQLPSSGGAAQHVEFLRGQVLVAGTSGAYTYVNQEWQEVKGLPYGAGIPAAIQDLRVKNGVAYAVTTPFGGRTSVFSLAGVSQEFSQVGTSTFPGFHGAQRGMIQANSTKVYMHYVALSNEPKGTYSIQPVIASAEDPTVITDELKLRYHVADGLLEFTSSTYSGILQVYSVLGNQVSQADLKVGSTTMIDVSYLSRGIYLVTFNKLAYQFIVP